MKSLNLGDNFPSKLQTMLSQKGEIIKFSTDPALSALCASLGLKSEFGSKSRDRIYPFLGFSDEPINWHSEIVEDKGDIGVVFNPVSQIKITPRHPDLRYILDSQSFDSAGNLSRIVIFPRRVAETYKEKGLEVIVVKNWFTSSFFQEKVNYLVANQWELHNDTGLMQAKMLDSGQLAFSGTHDIVDHLIGFDKELYTKSVGISKEVCLDFENQNTRNHFFNKCLLYAIGVFLDDIAQPVWYESSAHIWVIEKLIEAKKEHNLTADINDKTKKLPQSFHNFVKCVRESPSKIKKELEVFISECLA